MKRVLRTTFDPLPRSLPTPGLIALVALVVLGTAVTVHRYLESADTNDRRATASPSQAASWRPSEVRAAAREDGSPATRCPLFEACHETRPESSSAPGSEADPTSASSAPSVFRPDDGTVGG